MGRFNYLPSPLQNPSFVTTVWLLRGHGVLTLSSIPAPTVISGTFCLYIIALACEPPAGPQVVNGISEPLQFLPRLFKSAVPPRAGWNPLGLSFPYNFSQLLAVLILPFPNIESWVASTSLLFFHSLLYVFQTCILPLSFRQVSEPL